MKIRILTALLILLCAVPALLLLIPREPSQMPEPDTAAETLPETTEVPTVIETTTQIDPLQALLEGMTPEEKVGQLFLARCPEENAAEDAARFHLGGYLLFGRDFDGHTPDSLREVLHTYQSAAVLPMLIAVDEEGGDVCRVSAYPAFRTSRFGSPGKLYAAGGMERVLREEEEKAALLRSLGIHVNMAPVCDLSDSPAAFMYRRSLGQSPEITGQFVSGAIEIMDRYGIGAVMKHFPGYGNNSDTHTGTAVDNRSLSELEGRDLQPFFRGIEAGGNAILVSHTIVTCLDGELPASLSPAVHRYLRLAMDFSGVILTDDLCMSAVSGAYGTAEAAVLAVLAGNDLLCSTDYEIQYSAVLQAFQTGRIPEETVNAAVLRILKWKQKLGMLDS